MEEGFQPAPVIRFLGCIAYFRRFHAVWGRPGAGPRISGWPRRPRGSVTPRDLSRDLALHWLVTGRFGRPDSVVHVFRARRAAYEHNGTLPRYLFHDSVLLRVGYRLPVT